MTAPEAKKLPGQDVWKLNFRDFYNHPVEDPGLLKDGSAESMLVAIFDTIEPLPALPVRDIGAIVLGQLTQRA